MSLSTLFLFKTKNGCLEATTNKRFKSFIAVLMLLLTSLTGFAATYYSQGSIAPNLTASWNTVRAGGGTSPANFTSGDIFVIQNGHVMTTGATWSVSGAGSKVQIESGGTLTSTSVITLAVATTFQIDNGGSYNQNVAAAMGTNTLQGTEVFGASSNFTYNAAPTGTSAPTSPGYGNLTINTTTNAGAIGWGGTISQIQGNFNVTATGTGTIRHALTAGGNITVSVGGNFSLSGTNTNFWLSSGAGTCALTVGGNLSISGSALLDLANSSGAGTLNLGGNFSQTGGTFTTNSAVSTVNFTGGASSATFTQSSGTFTSTNINWSIASGKTLANTTVTSIVAASRTMTVNGTFQINQGSFSGSTGTWSYGAGATLIFNHTSGTYGPIDASHTYWPATNSPANVTVANNFTAPNGINLSVARTVSGIFQTAAGVTNANNLTLNGTGQINGGGFMTGTPTYGVSSTLVYNTTSYTTSTNEFPNTGVKNVTITAPSGTNTVTLDNDKTITGTFAIGAHTVNGGKSINAQSITMGAGSLVAGTLTTSVSFVCTGASSISMTGSWNVTGFTRSTSTVAFTGTGNLNSGSTFYNLTNSGGTRSITTDFNVENTLLVSGGTMLISGGTGKTLMMTGSASTINITAGAINGTDQGAGNDLTLNIAGTQTTLTGNATSNDDHEKKFFNVSVNNGSTLILSRGILCRYGNFVVNGTIQINANGYIQTNPSSSVVPNYNSSTGSLAYNNAGPFTTAGEWPASGSPANVSLIAAGTNVTLSGNRTISGILTLTDGIITTSANVLAVSNSATASVVRTNGYVIGNLQRAVATGTNTYDYAIGTSSGYTPASIAFSGATGAGSVTVVSLNGASSNYPPTLSPTKRVDRYWTVTNSGVSGFSADASFNYLGADLVGGATSATVHAYKFDAPSTFTDPPFTSGTNTFTVTGLTGFSEFGAGECTTICQNGGILDVQNCGCQCLSGYTGFNCEIINRSITTSVAGTTFCAGDALTVNYNAIAPVSWDPGNIFTAELSDASGSFASPVSIGSVSSTATGPGSISATIPLGTSFGAGYRIRVVSSNPVVTGTDNGSDLTINPNYTITASAGPNGSISPNGLTNHCSGTNQTYTITPDACYSIADVVVDGVSQGAIGSHTFTNITANHTISATFALTTYTITVTAGANGSITPGTGSVNCGDNATYTISPDACYSIADVVVDGVSQGAISSHTFTNVQANHTISASFALTTYTITVTAGANGSITPGTGSVNCGDNATYTISPDACYSIADVVVDGVSQGAISSHTFTNVQANHTISASFALTTYTITVTAGANGSITPGTGSVNCGDNATYTITPDACYSIADVIVDGVSQGAVSSHTFTNVQANHTISASFALTTYTITVTAGANGSITPGTGSVNCGDNATYTITPDACYSIADVIVDGVSQGAISSHTFTNVQANHTISATFALTTYTITVTAGANGSITPGTGSVNCGDNATYTITPDACYSIADVVVDGVSQGAISSHTFTNVQANHTISATFTLNTFTITVTAGANGSITPGTGSVNCGDNATYTITPDACYSIADVIVDGVSQGAITSHTFTNVQANHTISATFTLNTFTITVTAGANGSITPGTGSVNCGNNATYTITPDACYSIADVIVDGVSQGAITSHTFTNVQANHTISATFALTTYTITVTAGANGSITPGTGSVNCGDNATYTITPDACYSIADVIVDGVSQGAITSHTFTNVLANHTISATFVQITYTITVTAGANGSITPGTGSVNCGDNATYTITADPGYGIADVIVDGVSQGAITSHTFTNVQANHTISATFVVNATYTITSSAGPNGSISPNGATIVNSGANQSYTISPAACYHVLDVLVDAVSVGAVTSYTFTNVTANHTISATFAINAALLAPVVTGVVNVCPYIGTGDPVTYTFNSAGATGYSWILPPNVSLVGSTANSITVNFITGFAAQANKQIKVTALSPCGNSPQTIYYLLAQGPNTPAPIVPGSTNVCAVIGTPGTITYTINSVLGATGYTWTAQAGTTTINHPNGPGVNDTTVTVSFTNGFTNSSITVIATNGCGTSNARSYGIVRSNPSTPGLISGPTNVCENILPGGTAAVYKIFTVPNATSYTWNVTPGTAIVTHPNGAGPQDTVINVTFQAGFTSGSITVSASNGCGTSGVRSLSLSKLNPATPGIIDVIQLTACPNRMYSYTIAAVPANATSLVWTIPAGASLVSQSPAGPLPTSITVSYPNTAVNGNVTVQALNNCGSSTIRVSAVKLPACPPERSTLAAKGGVNLPVPAQTLQVNVYPNPSLSDFRLQVIASGNEVIRVRIMDMQGREFKNITVLPNQTTNIGSDLKAGSYMMEVRQGRVTKTTKLLKF